MYDFQDSFWTDPKHRELRDRIVEASGANQAVASDQKATALAALVWGVVTLIGRWSTSESSFVLGIAIAEKTLLANARTVLATDVNDNLIDPTELLK